MNVDLIRELKPILWTALITSGALAAVALGGALLSVF